MRSLPNSPLAILVALLAAAALLVAGCGGGADESTDPQELLSETFDGEKQVESGVLDVSVDANAGGNEGGTLTGTLSGPFQARDSDQVPLIDLSANIEVRGAGSGTQSFDGSITVTDDAAFVSTDGQAYQVDQLTFDALQQAYAESDSREDDAEDGAALFGQLGIDPSSWLTDVSNEGVEEVDGVETVHISGTPDVAKILDDAERIDPTGSASGGGKGIAKSVESASIDVYTGADDKILRRLDLSLSLDDPDSKDTLTVDLSIGISGVNEDQEITAPADAKPLDQLIPGGLGSLGQGGLGDIGGEGLDSLGGSKEYRECIAQAGSPDELASCAELL